MKINSRILFLLLLLSTSLCLEGQSAHQSLTIAVNSEFRPTKVWLPTWKLPFISPLQAIFLWRIIFCWTHLIGTSSHFQVIFSSIWCLLGHLFFHFQIFHHWWSGKFRRWASWLLITIFQRKSWIFLFWGIPWHTEDNSRIFSIWAAILIARIRLSWPILMICRCTGTVTWKLTAYRW